MNYEEFLEAFKKQVQINHIVEEAISEQVRAVCAVEASMAKYFRWHIWFVCIYAAIMCANLVLVGAQIIVRWL